MNPGISLVPNERLLGGTEQFVRMADGWLLRVGIWAASRPSSVQPKGTLFFLNGRGDFLEKYAEFCMNMAEAGYNVVSWDWRGQGLSGRTTSGDPRSHLESFDILVDDAIALLGHTMFAELPRPWSLAAHSMGGHLALRLLAAKSDIVSKAILLAPMMGILTAPMSAMMARRFVRFMCSIGQGTRYAPGQGSYGLLFRSPIRQRRLTGDTGRFAAEGDAIKANPKLAIGGVTIGWSQAAFDSIDMLFESEDVAAIRLPILMFLAGLEYIVDSEAAARFAERLPNCAVRRIEGARHEMLRESDAIRKNVIDQICAFLQSATAGA
jgi:lysophospholipase